MPNSTAWNCTPPTATWSSNSCWTARIARRRVRRAAQSRIERALPSKPYRPPSRLAATRVAVRPAIVQRARRHAWFDTAAASNRRGRTEFPELLVQSNQWSALDRAEAIQQRDVVAAREPAMGSRFRARRAATGTPACARRGPQKYQAGRLGNPKQGISLPRDSPLFPAEGLKHRKRLP